MSDETEKEYKKMSDRIIESQEAVMVFLLYYQKSCQACLQFFFSFL